MIELKILPGVLYLGADAEDEKTFRSFTDESNRVFLIDPRLLRIQGDGQKTPTTGIRQGRTIHDALLAKVLDGRPVFSTAGQAVAVLANGMFDMDSSPNLIPFRAEAEDEVIVIRVHQWWHGVRAVLSIYTEPLDSKTVFPAGLQLFFPS
ncbi:MAG: hypothetical protein UX77_C0004G0003 [Parcubacteria group bacterium GW2011_GWA1_47_11]|uniref:Uncharacterized protein n=1 Tax=Candidatus Nomurabacteria bacterium GW2011_GWB1_47_6 TaxID=1618749 RepID=A0A0G1T2E6_9BACT|nr:MAG: hypothetical protein UX77_C0004G0003 [Parcubacteria group bacterium GW2011_GWA1_47_11]KKU75939.1 MAG: hypothetical protein UY01_C0001G0035 [Candidatus Nomurabacteria bacterium GW2011_GWB1_47_6]